jgi:insertion element IS1 protein InsB
MHNQIHCPRCYSANVKKNGFYDSNKQSHCCKACHKKFTDDGSRWFVSGQQQELVKRLLLERLSLRGICRAVEVSMSWLMTFIKELYAALPDDLNCEAALEKVKKNNTYYIKLFHNEADELWSFVGKRSNVYYVWLVVHRQSRQVIAFHVGDRSRASAKQLWAKIPAHIQKFGLFHTDNWKAYQTVIPEERHLYSTKKKWTNHVERLNCTLRQRIARLVRETLSFSKILTNHIGAIKYFLCHYNLDMKNKFSAPTL